MSSHPIGRTPGAGSTQTRQISGELKLSDVWRFAVQRRIWLISGLIAGVLWGIWTTAVAPRLYTSTTTVELNSDGATVLGIQDLSGLGASVTRGQEFMTDMLTIQAVLANRSTALSVIEALDLMHQHPYIDLPGAVEIDKPGGPTLEQMPQIRDRALILFGQGLRIEVVKNTKLMSISYTDTDKERAAKIANAVVQAYLKNHTEARYKATATASQWLSAQLEGLKRKVEDSQKKVSAFQQNSGVIGTSSMPGTKSGGAEDFNSTDLQRLTALNAEFSRAEVARIEREAVYRLTQTNSPDVILGAATTSLATAIDNTPLAIGGKNTAFLQNLHEQIVMLRVRLAAQELKYGPKYPAVLEIKTQIASLEAQSAGELKRINEDAKAAYEVSKANEDALRKSVEDQQRKVFSLGNSLTALTFLQQEENTSRTLYQDLYTRLEEANIAAGVKSTDMVVADPARVPSQISSPSLRTHIVSGVLVWLGLGFIVALVLHIRDTALHTPEDFDASWHVPLLGIVPKFGGKPSRGRRTMTPAQATAETADAAWLLSSPKSKVAESYRQIRTSILLTNIDKPPQVILFTSALSGDGKSTTAYNLAVAYAVQNSRVIMLDADMRRPTIREKSGVLGKLGLSDLLAQDLPLESVLQTHPMLSSLSVLTAGTIPPMPAELLGSQRFARLIEKLRGQFDYILIDAPPTLLVTDPLLIASHADGVVAVLRSGVTTRHIINLFAAALTKPNVKVLGYVLNGFDPTSQNYGYGSGYGYGYGYNSKGGYYEEIPQG